MNYTVFDVRNKGEGHLRVFEAFVGFLLSMELVSMRSFMAFFFLRALFVLKMWFICVLSEVCVFLNFFCGLFKRVGFGRNKL